ncbi:MAG: hypothetical protein COA33_000220 [Fluviicola sp.]|nr:hypothetical protein [Fluviicola sp.]
MKTQFFKSNPLSDSLLIKNKETLIPILVFFFGIWYFCLRILGTGLEFIPGDLGDSRFINFLLEHGHQWLHGNVNNFWDANFMHPFKNTIAISDNMLGTMPIYSLFRSFGISVETSYQLWWIVICSLNFWSAFFVVKKWFNRWDIAIIVAWVFAFTIFNMGQLNYMQMMIRFMVPIAFYAATKMIETKEMKYFILYSFALIFQFYSVIYTGLFLLYFSVFYIFIFAIVKKEYFFFTYLFRKKNLLKTALTITLSVILMLLIIVPYLNIAEIIGYKTYPEVQAMLPTWKSYLFPNETTYSWTYLNRNFQPSDIYWLHYNFMGILHLLTLVSLPFLWVYWKIKKIRPSRLIIALSITVFIIFLFYFKFDNGFSLYEFVFKLPGMNSIRVMNRFIHVTIFMLLILFALFLLKIPKKWTPFIFLLAVFDNSFTTENLIRQDKLVVESRRVETIQLVKNNRSKSDLSFAIINPNEPPFMTHIDAMFTALELKFPTLNGYSSHGPVNHSVFFQQDNMEGLEKWLDYNTIKKEDVLILERRQ